MRELRLSCIHSRQRKIDDSVPACNACLGEVWGKAIEFDKYRFQFDVNTLAGSRSLTHRSMPAGSGAAGSHSPSFVGGAIAPRGGWRRQLLNPSRVADSP